jgi:hypothetical protein
VMKKVRMRMAKAMIRIVMSEECLNCHFQKIKNIVIIAHKCAQ